MGMDSKLAAPKMYLMENDQLVSNGRIRSTYKVASPIELNMIGHKRVSHPLPIPGSR
jgi:hypothetical protein